MALRLNLGAGAVPLDGYENLDRATGQEVYPLPYADGSAEMIRASHVLEHFSHRETMKVLAEWVRVLEPGGWLRVAVPDFDRIIECYESGGQYPIEGWLMGGHVDANDHHGAIFAEEPLAHALQIAGLVEVRRWESDAPDCSSLPISLNIEGRKPLPGEDFRPVAPEPDPAPVQVERPPKGAIQAVMTLPRLAFTDNMFSALQALVPLGIGLERSTGVFWGQCLTKLIERKIADDARYVLTLDYDTVFTAADVLELYRLLETRPEIDAVCAFQWRRDKTSPLFTMERADSCDQPREIHVPFDHLRAEAMRLRTGHFGLTLFRAAAFADVERPWFHSVPGTDGRWDDKRMDEDIAFWHRWAEAGKTLYQANRCAVGHLQLVVTWPGRMMTAHHQYVPDWTEHGKPAEAWR